jgi:hypothetical protein
MSMRAVIIVMLLNIAGCSTTRTESHEETVTRTQDPQSTYDNGERTEVVSKSSSEHEESSSASCSGVLSCIVHATGKVIAFPFILIGDAFDALF